MPSPRRILVLVPVVLAVLGSALGADEAREPHVQVGYDGVPPAYAEAVARLVEASREVYVRDFGFDMPELVQVRMDCAAENALRLWTDGEDHVTWTLKTVKQLAKPSESGAFNVYGLCHEVGHMAMYRLLKKRAWLKGEAAEGWAHYCGSVVLDRVSEASKEGLWPDRYDWRADGLPRLEAQLAKADKDPVVSAAGRWRDLVSMIGEKKAPRLFRAWNEAEVDPTRPDPALRAVLMALVDEEARPRAAAWMDGFARECVAVIEASAEVFRPIEPSALSGSPVTLAWDDGTSEGAKSIAGGGHAVLFDAPAGEWYITAIRVFGARYGKGPGPEEEFTITLCDGEMKPIHAWAEPYSTIERGEPDWYRIALDPGCVPERFAICIDFAPTASKGVYMQHDDSSSGHSLVGLPGAPGKAFAKGNWMIRVELDTRRGADPLHQK